MVLTEKCRVLHQNVNESKHQAGQRARPEPAIGKLGSCLGHEKKVMKKDIYSCEYNL